MGALRAEFRAQVCGTRPELKGAYRLPTNHPEPSRAHRAGKRHYGAAILPIEPSSCHIGSVNPRALRHTFAGSSDLMVVRV